MSNRQIIANVLRKFLFRYAGPLSDPSHLRYQAIFLMGTAGSGKSYVVDRKYLKYMPGAGAQGAAEKDLERLMERKLTEGERSLTNVNFEKSVKYLQGKGFQIEYDKNTGGGRIPFRLYDFVDADGDLVPRSEWAEKLPQDIYEEVKGLEEVIFGAPAHELPSYWRQVNPDVFKEELKGYRPDSPGYVHPMSSDMSKAYFNAALETGDPVVVDGTGANLDKMVSQMKAAKQAGYRVSVLYVHVPLAIALLRNAGRKRSVEPSLLVAQNRVLPRNYNKLKTIADVAHVISNRNDSFDKSTWARMGDKIDAWFYEKSGMSYYDFVATHAPKDLDVLKQLGISPN